MSKRIREWLGDRFGLELLWKTTMARRVAKGEWYFGDGATLTLLLGVLIVTGVLMSMTYSPSTDTAYASVQYLTEQQFLGRFIRGLHYWAAGLMVVMLVFHVLRQVLLGGYKSPREGTWLVGVLLFFAILVLSFTGYVLRWDERSVYALRVALHMASNVPWIGEELVVLMQGGRELGPLTLSRIFGIHVIVLPLLTLGLVAWHVYLVILHGTTSRSEREQPVANAEKQRELYRTDAKSRKRGEWFFPETVSKSGLMAGTFLLLVFALAVLVGPPALYSPANLTEISTPIEEWWFWWYSSLIALLPSAVAPGFVVLFPLVVFLAMVALPFLDRGPNRGLRHRPLAVGVVVAIVLTLLALSALRLSSPWTAWPSEDAPPVPAGVEISPAAERGRQLFSRYSCNSCHAVSGHGRQVAIDLALLDGQMSRAELVSYIAQPPEGIAMPAYGHRMSKEELSDVADFVLAAQTFPRQIP